VKGAYDGVTRWVRFNAWMTLHELQHCNEHWLAPHVNLFLEGPRPRPDVPSRLLSLIEEAASAIWLMYREHEALLERLHELFGPREPVEWPEAISSVFHAARGPEAGLLVVRRSLDARVSLLEGHSHEVDAHTRLVLKKHLTILAGMVRPALGAVANDPALGLPGDAADAVAAPDDLVGRYRSYLPGGPRPHPDNFLALALLAGEAKRERVGAGS
jgi:hypothetical protein